MKSQKVFGAVRTLVQANYTVPKVSESVYKAVFSLYFNESCGNSVSNQASIFF